MPEAKSFMETLKDLRRGELLSELTDHLCEVVTAVRATGGAGTLTLTIRIKPFSKGDMSTLAVTDDIKTSLTTLEKGATILFANERNELQRQDPRQPELTGLRQPAPVTTMRTVEKGAVIDR